MRRAVSSSLALAAASAAPGHTFRRYVDEKTKGNEHMKHLDLYARRDAQLAPFLLREVDIEWKRKCRKVNFVAWFAVFVFLVLVNQRVAGEGIYHLRRYIELVVERQDADDEDSDHRRAKLVSVMNLVDKAYQRNGVWTKKDSAEAIAALRDAGIATSQLPDTHAK